MHLRVERVELVEPRVRLHHLGLALAEHLVRADDHRLARALGGLLDLHDGVDPDGASLVKVHQTQQGDRRALLFAARDSLVLALGLEQVVVVDELVPGGAVDLLLGAVEMVLAAAFGIAEVELAIRGLLLVGTRRWRISPSDSGERVSSSLNWTGGEDGEFGGRNWLKLKRAAAAVGNRSRCRPRAAPSI